MRKTFTYNGKRYYVERKTEEELYMAVAEKKLQLQNDYKKETEARFTEYAFSWLEVFKKPYVTKKTSDMYRSAIRCIDKYIGHKRLKDITSTDIQNVITAEYKLGRSKSRIDKLILTFRAVFKRAEIDRKIRNNPTQTIQRPNMDENISRALTDTEYEAIMKVSETSRYGLWIRTMLCQGLRPSETARLKHEHIDLKEGMMYVDGTKSRRAKRFLPLSSGFLALYKRGNAEDYIFSTLGYKNGSKSISEQTRERWWKYFKRELDIHMGAKLYRNKIIESVIEEDVSPYMLRHTFATKMASKIPVNDLADIMGHSNINITYKYYIHYNEENMNRIKCAMLE